MARTKLIGFETGDSSELATLTSGFTIASGLGTYGNYVLSCTGTNTTTDQTILSGLDGSNRQRFRFRFKYNNTSGIYQFWNMILGIDSGGTNSTFRISADNISGGASNIYLKQADNTYPPGWTDYTYTLNTWVNIALDVTAGSTTTNGSASLYIDGDLYYSTSAGNFGIAGTTPTATIRSYYHLNSSASVTAYLDDFALDDAVVPGIGGIIARQFLSTTPFYNDFTKQTGSTIDTVWNDTPFSATTYARTAITGVGQSGVVSSFSSTQTGHGSGVINSGDTINAVNLGLVGKTAFTTAAGITLVGNAQGGSSTAGANITLTFDTAPIAGDVVIVSGGFGTAGANNPGISTSGYTAQVTDNGTATRRFGIWTKVMGTTPDTTVVCLGSGAAGDGVAYACIVLRQTDNYAVLDITAAAVATGSSTNPNPPASGATVTANAWAIACAASAVSDSSKGNQTNYTQRASANAGATRPFGTASSTRTIVSAGTNEDPPAWSSWSTGAWVAATIIIRPATAAGSYLSGLIRWGSTDRASPANTLTTSDAYYGYVHTSVPSVTDLNASEWGAIHGNNSALQTVEDVWAMVDFTPTTVTSIRAKLVSINQAIPRSNYW